MSLNIAAKEIAMAFETLTFISRPRVVALPLVPSTNEIQAFVSGGKCHIYGYWSSAVLLKWLQLRVVEMNPNYASICQLQDTSKDI